MATLVRAISPDDSPIQVNASASVASGYPWRFTLESEAVYVHGASPDGTLLSITRGADGTTAASHAAGTVLTAAPLGAGGGGGSISGTDGTTTVNPMTSLRLPAGTLTDLGSGVGGVGMVLRQLGPVPFVVADHISDAYQPELITGIPDGAVVLRVFAVCTTDVLQSMASPS